MTNPEMISAVDRACQRSAAVVHADMHQGLSILASNACIAPWIGLLGTLLGIVNSFHAITGGTSIPPMASMAEELSKSIWPTALGLIVGLISLWFYRYLSGQLESIDCEMSDASHGLVTQLSRYRGHSTTPATDRPIELPSFDLRSEDDAAWLGPVVISFAALIITWCTRAAEYFYYESTPFHSAAASANIYVLVMTGISCLYAAFHRKPAKALLLGSAMCLGVNLIELAFRMGLL